MNLACEAALGAATIIDRWRAAGGELGAGAIVRRMGVGFFTYTWNCCGDPENACQPSRALGHVEERERG